MPLITIKCPNCSAEKKMTFLDVDYKGAYACWKCHSMFNITVQNKQMTSFQPLSREDWQRQQALEKASGKHSDD